MKFEETTAYRPRHGEIIEIENVGTAVVIEGLTVPETRECRMFGQLVKAIALNDASVMETTYGWEPVDHPTKQDIDLAKQRLSAYHEQTAQSTRTRAREP